MSHDSDGPSPDRMWRRQEARGDLALAFWDLLGGRPGWRLADVGCGPGGFTLRYSALTGPTGHVHAIDVDPEAILYLLGKLDPVHHANVTTEVLDIARDPLPDLRFDAIVASAMLHHVADVDAALRNLRVANTRILVAEFDPDGPGDIGPPVAERIAPEALAKKLRAAGFVPGSPRALAHETYAIVAK